MPVIIRAVALVCFAFCAVSPALVDAAEREQVRAVVNLISAVRMPYPLTARGNTSRTERVRLDATTATIACVRVDDYDLEGLVDVGATTKLEGQPHAPVGAVSQFFLRGTDRGQQLKADYQRMYDDGIQIALKHLGE